MDKEKELQETAREWCKIQYDGVECEDGCKVRRDGRLCECGQYAELLMKAGYRKADNVRKETAREIKNLVSLLPFIAEDGKELDVLTMYLNTMIVTCEECGNG